VDDDCDTVCDNGYGCCAGTSAGSCSMYDACTGTVTCSAGCVPGVCDLGPPPAGDSCGGAILVTEGTYTGTTCGANHDFAAVTCDSGTASPDVVYRFDLGMQSDVVIDTAGTTWDTVLMLYSGGCPGTEINCDDDGGAGLDSLITATLGAGTYWVVVDGYGSGHGGPYTMHLDITPRGDTCDTAVPLSLGAGRTTATGSTAGATGDESCGSGPDVWYSFTLSQQELVYLNTHGSSFDTTLALRSGSCGAGTTNCVDDSCEPGYRPSELLLSLAAGTYYVVVDGFGGQSGSYVLNVEHLPVGNEGSAVALAAGTSVWSGMTSGSGVVVGSCAGNGPEDLYYWTQCPTAAGGAFSATTCFSTGYDTVLYVRSGPTGEDLACDDDDSGCSYSTRSTISATIPSGFGLFGVYADSYYGGSGGDYQASITRP
jgi:hypothetical protein